jgi:hypothetical protein
MRFDTIELADATRPGGAGRTERGHREYVVNGRRLSRLLPVRDFISPFGWMEHKSEAEFARMLLLTRPSPLASPSRVPLYVCPECADLGCGAVTACVVRYDDRYAWKDFALEYNYESEPTETFAAGYEFHFARAAYETTFRPLA